MIAFGQFKNHRSDYVLIFCFMLENTFPIAKITFFLIEGFYLLSRNIHGVARHKSILDFSSVSTNILNRSSSDIARNQGHIFQSAKILTDGPQNEFMPVFTRLRFYPNKIIVFLNGLFSF